MKKDSLLIIFLLAITTSAHAQKAITGYLKEQQSQHPIAYANIGILNSSIGTISNEDGSFLVIVPENHTQDTLIFSALGYARKAVPVPTLTENQNNTILLSEKRTMLSEVTVSANKGKKKVFELGNRFHKGGVNLCSSEDASAGASVALLIQNSYPSFYKDLFYPFYIERAKVRIEDNTLGDFKVRVRLYDVDTLTGLPGEDLLHESVILESHIANGWLTFDLSAFKLQIDRPFFVAFEWILDKSERQRIAKRYREFETSHPERVHIDTTKVEGQKLSTVRYYNFLNGISFGVSLLPYSLTHYQCYARYNSFGEWKRTAFILTARVSVSNYRGDLPALE